MSNKTMKILIFIATLIFVIAMCSSVVLAANPGEIMKNISNAANNSETNTNELTRLGGNILNVLQIVGIIAGAIILVVLGLKYMMGSLEEKAEYKKTMIPFVVGAIVVMAAPTLTNGIFTLIQNLGK